MFGYAWVRDDRPDSTALFEGFDFEPIARFPDFYAGSERTSCPDCGVVRSDDRTCECAAVLYARDLP